MRCWAVGGCGGHIDGRRKLNSIIEGTVMSEDFKTIAKVGSIPEGEGKAFPFAGKLIAVFNDGGTYRAIDDFCPHMGASLAEGHLENGVVACPWHS